MAIEWTEKLTTHIQEIDDQHKQLFDIINDLLAAYQEGSEKDKIGAAIDFLEKYAIIHFDNEESYMRRYDYPESSQHVASHLEFIENLLDIKKRYMLKGMSRRLMNQTNQMIVNWWLDHIQKVDKVLGDYLKTKGL